VAGRGFDCRIGPLESTVTEGVMARAWQPALLATVAVLFVYGLALADGGGGGGGGDQGRRAKRQPGNADAYNWLAYATRKNGDPAKSIPIYEKALALDPKHLGAHEYAGEAYLALDDLPKAKEYLARLNRLCLFGCEQYRDLKKAVEAYEKSAGKVKPAATRN
jgi:tetratricopeptide (TPR) repeat protein